MTTDADDNEQGVSDYVSTFVPQETDILSAPMCDQANVDKHTLWQKQCDYIQPIFNLQINMFETR